MPMIGDLQSFALPDLLRTLGNARQSGQLSVWNKEGVYRIWLNQGSISAAIAPNPEGVLKVLCLNVMNPDQGALLQPLRPTTTPLSVALGDWLIQQGWMTRDECALVFQLQLHLGLYPLFELASGQFYFVGDMVPLPYWQMTGLELPALDAIAHGLDVVNGKATPTLDLPPLETQFLTVGSTDTALRLSLVDKRLLQWFKQPNTILSLSQVLNVQPLELQKACQRLLHLRLIKVAPPESSFVPQLSSPAQQNTDVSFSTKDTSSPAVNHTLVQRIAAVLNKPVVGKSK